VVDGVDATVSGAVKLCHWSIVRTEVEFLRMTPYAKFAAVVPATTMCPTKPPFSGGPPELAEYGVPVAVSVVAVAPVAVSAIPVVSPPTERATMSRPKFVVRASPS
jgi:hypothetical protein